MSGRFFGRPFPTPAVFRRTLKSGSSVLTGTETGDFDVTISRGLWGRGVDVRRLIMHGDIVSGLDRFHVVGVPDGIYDPSAENVGRRSRHAAVSSGRTSGGVAPKTVAITPLITMKDVRGKPCVHVIYIYTHTRANNFR